MIGNNQKLPCSLDCADSEQQRKSLFSDILIWVRLGTLTLLSVSKMTWVTTVPKNQFPQITHGSEVPIINKLCTNYLTSKNRIKKWQQLLLTIMFCFPWTTYEQVSRTLLPTTQDKLTLYWTDQLLSHIEVCLKVKRPYIPNCQQITSVYKKAC